MVCANVKKFIIYDLEKMEIIFESKLFKNDVDRVEFSPFNQILFT
jgi:hypothetical protein